MSHIFHFQSPNQESSTLDRYIDHRSIEIWKNWPDPTVDAPPRATHIFGSKIHARHAPTSILSMLMSADPGKKKKKSPFYFPLYAFYFICNIQKKILNFEFQNSKFENSKKRKRKKKRKKWHWPLRKKKKKIRILNFEFHNSKKKKLVGTFWFYLNELRSSQAIEPLSWDFEPKPFQDPSLEQLSSDPSHWAMIRPSHAEIYFKPKSKPPSLWAIEPRYEPSRVEPRYLSYSFVNKLKGFIKITPCVWGGMLTNPT